MAKINQSYVVLNEIKNIRDLNSLVSKLIDVYGIPRSVVALIYPIVMGREEDDALNAKDKEEFNHFFHASTVGRELSIHAFYSALCTTLINNNLMLIEMSKAFESKEARVKFFSVEHQGANILHVVCAIGNDVNLKRISLEFTKEELNAMLSKSDSDGKTPLCVAIAYKEEKCARCLLEIDPGCVGSPKLDKEGLGLFHYATMLPKFFSVLYYHLNITNPSLLGEHLLQRSSQGVPLILKLTEEITTDEDGNETKELKSFNLHNFKLVVDHFRTDLENIFASYKGFTVVHSLCNKGHLFLLQILIATVFATPSSNAHHRMYTELERKEDHLEDTPLHLAVKGHHSEMVKALASFELMNNQGIALHIKKNVENKHRCTPLDIAQTLYFNLDGEEGVQANRTRQDIKDIMSILEKDVMVYFRIPNANFTSLMNDLSATLKKSQEMYRLELETHV